MHDVSGVVVLSELASAVLLSGRRFVCLVTEADVNAGLTKVELSIGNMVAERLLKEVQSDFILSRYSVIIIDEAHERNINTGNLSFSILPS